MKLDETFKNLAQKSGSMELNEYSKMISKIVKNASVVNKSNFFSNNNSPPVNELNADLFDSD